MKQGEEATADDTLSVWALMQRQDPFYEMLAEQAAPLLGIEHPLNLDAANVKDADFVPYVGHGTGRSYLLGDVLTAMAARGGLKPPQFPSTVATTLEAARAVLKRRVGPSPPAWHDEKRHRSNADVAGVAASQKPVLPVAPSVVTSAAASGDMWSVSVANLRPPKPILPKAANRPIKQVSGTITILGGRLIKNITEFSCLGDFMQHAFPDDEWLFAVPNGGEGRPYDFLESLLAGETDVPWKVMTYREYLSAMLDAASREHAQAIAEAEAVAVAQASEPKQD
jgi:hypothetical protein